MALYCVYVVSPLGSGTIRSHQLDTNSFAKAKGKYLSLTQFAALNGTEAVLIMRCANEIINTFDYRQPVEKVTVRSH